MSFNAQEHTLSLSLSLSLSLWKRRTSGNRYPAWSFWIFLFLFTWVVPTNINTRIYFNAIPTPSINRHHTLAHHTHCPWSLTSAYIPSPSGIKSNPLNTHIGNYNNNVKSYLVNEALWVDFWTNVDMAMVTTGSNRWLLFDEWTHRFVLFLVSNNKLMDIKQCDAPIVQVAKYEVARVVAILMFYWRNSHVFKNRILRR